jgi:hypothetical protein
MSKKHSSHMFGCDVPCEEDTEGETATSDPDGDLSCPEEEGDEADEGDPSGEETTDSLERPLCGARVPDLNRNSNV